MSEERRWWVCTPEYGTVVPILDYGQGPMEYGCDVVAVWARTKREAKVKAVPLLRKVRGGWLADCDGNPFVGLTVELHECQHGRDAEGEVCDECEAAFIAQLDNEPVEMTEENIAEAERIRGRMLAVVDEFRQKAVAL